MVLSHSGFGTPPPPAHPFVQKATSLGYHFLGLAYPDAPTVNAACTYTDRAGATDGDCFLHVRLARLSGGIYGGTDMHLPVTNVSQVDGGLFRLVVVLKQAEAADKSWAQYLVQAGLPQLTAPAAAAHTVLPPTLPLPTPSFAGVGSSDDGVAWRKVVLAGHSQGSGMALLLGKYKPVLRVVQLAGVDDVVQPAMVPAPWVTGQSVTPPHLLFGLGNINGFACEASLTTLPRTPVRPRFSCSRVLVGCSLFLLTYALC